MALHYIAIDLGAESGRVMLGSLEGGRLKLAEVHRFPNGPVRLEGTLRWDLLRLWEEIKVGLRKAAALDLPVASVSVDSWGVDYVLGRAAEPMLRVPFCYRDGRTAVPYEDVRRAIGEDEIYEHTGIQFMPLNTLYQIAAEQRQDPVLLGHAEHFLMIGDWFHRLLCGAIVQEESNASTTQLWDPRRRAWSGELIERLGLPPRLFPRVVPPCSRLGVLTDAVCAETGLRKIEVVAGCVHDTGAAVAAVPAEGGGWAYLSSGTWSLIGVELPAPLITPGARAANFTNETGLGGTARFLRNASGLWILQECRRAWERTGQKIEYDELTRLAGDAEPFRSLVVPTDPLFLNPDDMPGAVCEFCRRTGQPQPGTPGEFARCTLESLALLYAGLMDQLEAVTGQSLNTLHIVGGGSRNALLNQMSADATGRTVIAGPVEATAIGNALLQALTLGHIESHAALRAVVRESFRVEKFTPSSPAAWRAARSRFEMLQGIPLD
jgi:rhamnulokinase